MIALASAKQRSVFTISIALVIMYTAASAPFFAASQMSSKPSNAAAWWTLAQQQAIAWFWPISLTSALWLVITLGLALAVTRLVDKADRLPGMIALLPAMALVLGLPSDGTLRWLSAVLIGLAWLLLWFSNRPLAVFRTAQYLFRQEERRLNLWRCALWLVGGIALPVTSLLGWTWTERWFLLLALVAAEGCIRIAISETEGARPLYYSLAGIMTLLGYFTCAAILFNDTGSAPLGSGWLLAVWHWSLAHFGPALPGLIFAGLLCLVAVFANILAAEDVRAVTVRWLAAALALMLWAFRPDLPGWQGVLVAILWALLTAILYLGAAFGLYYVQDPSKRKQTTRWIRPLIVWTAAALAPLAVASGAQVVPKLAPFSPLPSWAILGLMGLTMIVGGKPKEVKVATPNKGQVKPTSPGSGPKPGTSTPKPKEPTSLDTTPKPGPTTNKKGTPNSPDKPDALAPADPSQVAKGALQPVTEAARSDGDIRDELERVNAALEWHKQTGRSIGALKKRLVALEVELTNKSELSKKQQSES